MRLRLTKIDEFQFLTCFKNGLWGSKSARFKDWQIGDTLAFIVDKNLAACAKVSGESFISRERIWDNGIFPHRIPIQFTHVLKPNERPPILGEIRDVLTELWGPKYGWGILNQQVIKSPHSEVILKSLTSRRNRVKEYQENLSSFLEEANIKREQKIEKKAKKKVEKIREEGEVGTKREESAHSKAQSELIELGRLTGCSIWIASNDRNRKYRGKKLSENCLSSLPNLGLSEEATRRISLIDILWIYQNAPVCAFEIETSTSIYSGLLRMSDLLSVVPALNIKIFIVAPRQRQDRVMNELSRPTFQKIGLSEYCRYISSEDLASLIEKVKGLGGHIQTSILDTVAIALEEDESIDGP